MASKGQTVPTKEGMSRSGSESVEHNYHDFSWQQEGSKLVSNSDNGKSTTADNAFPVKLHDLLTFSEENGLTHVISWQPHGRCFVVRNQKLFTEHLLSQWFRQSKFPSFQRQLNLYGFKRLTAGNDKGGYYHELLLRGKRFLAFNIPRQKVKGEGPRKSYSPGTEPNFYNMPFLPHASSSVQALPFAQATPLAPFPFKPDLGLQQVNPTLFTNNALSQQLTTSWMDSMGNIGNILQQPSNPFTLNALTANLAAGQNLLDPNQLNNAWLASMANKQQQQQQQTLAQPSQDGQISGT